jgi:hypothetical protein
VNENEALLHSVLAKRTFTPGYEFALQVEGRIPQEEVYQILLGMQEQGLAELAYGRGWRAVEQEPTGREPEVQLYRDWQEQVALGLTVLGYPEWVNNKALAAGWDPDKEREEEHGRTD